MPKRSKYPMPPKKPKPVAPQPTGQATPEDAESFAQTLIHAAEQVRSYATQLRAEGADDTTRYLARTALVTQCRVLLDETQAFSDRV
ncbi:MAG TPA: hypothetical protein VHR15_13990 [Ktedonobacterales bacterium]|nr:hypothetical protein [Ktedonobacterales bacterium]